MGWVWSLIGFLVLAPLPALVFVAMFRLIDYMALDGIDDLRNERSLSDSSPRRGSRAVDVTPDREARDAIDAETTRRCRACGQRNDATYEFCRRCQARLY